MQAAGTYFALPPGVPSVGYMFASILTFGGWTGDPVPRMHCSMGFRAPSGAPNLVHCLPWNLL